uniref:Fungal lipase-type domain-containing protein n=2 Tax=Cyclophora tenuis TaxID=216820 RepID=A0A7S1D2T9_CYCTE|mmetsp:Transcript_20242/g.34551  ORF Transcript_20242/g.34551 Transcript_20242/m.34551 type:complete len:204 (+) Transcript_20242:61-672(+)
MLALLEEHPDFKIYVTGHSLGGALATLFAFETAASVDPRIPKPVSCITIASPKVGGLTFRRAFQALERQGVMRCLRIANNKDLVTLLPDRGSLSCLYIMCCQSHVFRHVGIELKLYKNGTYSLSRPTETTSYVGLFCKDWSKQAMNGVGMVLTLPMMVAGQEDFLNYHSCMEYLARLQKCSDKTRGLYLNKLYESNANVKTTN